MADGGSVAWDLFVELRKELVALQGIRARVIGFKITLVSAGVGIIVANLKGGVPPALLVVPAFAAMFFDLLMHSYSFSIKRTGYYCRKHLEPLIRDQVITLLSEKRVEELVDIAQRENIREELRVSINEQLSRAKVRSLYFVKYVFQ